MKAFQLKIAIKNSKPPIWRRVIVPSGITFSQLSMILNEVMGWCGYHIFEFEFYHMEVKLIEDAEDFDIGYGPFDYLEASENFIREYLEKNDWFTYTYDMGDDWQHRVTVEKIIDDYEYPYPQVIKYKGDCPVEDCGGIYGYYECLDIISDNNNPEYQERLEWMESQGYPNEYDMDGVNETLKEKYLYTYGKADKRCQSEIYEDHFAGKYGLKATKKDKNTDVARNVSGKHTLEESIRMFADAFKSQQNMQNQIRQQSLKDIFDDYEKEDIAEIAKDKGLSGVSKLSKAKLIDRVTEHMLQPSVMRAYFLCLMDDEIAEFEKACKTDGLYTPNDAALFMKLYETSYIGMLSDGQVLIPNDVKSVYRSINDKDFAEERKITSYLLCCLQAAECLYGITPMEIFEQLLAKNMPKTPDRNKIKLLMVQIPAELMKFTVKNEKIYADELYPDDRGLLAAQADKEFYIPTLKEILDFGRKGYDTDNKAAKKLEQFLLKKTDALPDEARCVTGFMQIHITAGCDMHDIFQMLEEFGISLESERDLNGLIQCINELWNSTRMITNRGYTPNELSRSDIIDLATERQKKIYPNDSCPCGSGKKYKNCCKNKSK